MESSTQVEQNAVKQGPPEVAPASKSKESKRGGKRPGAGRKPNLAKRLLKGFSRGAIQEAVANVDVGAVVASLLKSKREKTKLETLIFLRDTFWGRPSQNVSLSGGLVHAHTTWRSLATLSDEEVQMLDAITRKLVAPTSGASPNGQQNQIESKPALEAEVLESQTLKA